MISANPVLSLSYLGFAVAGACLANRAHAASFDCGVAQGRLERAVCNDPEASRADDTMAAAYWRARQALPPPRRITLLHDQRNFLGKLSGLCVNEQSGVIKTPYSACIARRLSARAAILQASVPQMPRYTYAYDSSSRERAMTKRSEDFDPNIPFRSERTVTLRIIRPIDSAAKSFNAAMRHEAKQSASVLIGSGGKDPFADPDLQGSSAAHQWLVASSDEIASVYVGADAFTGGAHPYYRGTATIWSFRLNRFLRNEDVFRRANDPRLVDLVRARLRDGERKLPKECLTYMTSVPLNGFTIDRHGMTFWFDSRLCESSAALSWAELKPFLKTNMPFDPAKLRANPHGNRAWANLEPISQPVRRL